MEYLNHLQKLPLEQHDPVLIKTFIQLLAPFAPHMCEELWQFLGEKGLVCQASWPKLNPEYLVRDTVCVVVQVNGKLRDKMDLAADCSEDDVKTQARASEKVASFLSGKQIVKEIYVPGRLLNFVVK